jgi:hypothetical protein
VVSVGMGVLSLSSRSALKICSISTTERVHIGQV